MPGVERTRLQQGTFLVLFVLAAYAFWRTLEPIWVPVLLGLVIAVGVHPIHERLLRRLGGKHPGLPAALLTGVVMVLALAITTFLVFVVVQRVLEFARQLAASYGKKGAAGLLGPDLNVLLSRLGVPPEEINQRIAEAAREFAAFLGKGATSIVTGLFTAIFIFIFTAITSYYLLREGTEGTYWLVVIAIFGGIEAFGILGVILGPIAVAVLLSLLRIYQRDYRPEGPVHAHDPTQPDGSALQTAPLASGAEEELHARHAALDESER